MKAKVLVLMFLSIFISLCGCGRKQTFNDVGTVGFLSGNKFELKIRNHRHPVPEWGVKAFTTNSGITPKMIQNQIGNNTVSFQTQGWYITVDNMDGTQDNFYIIYQSEYSYILTNLGVSVVFDDTTTEHTILLPVQLINDKRLLSFSSLQLYSGIPYESMSGIDSFYEFYEQSGWYDTEINGNILTINSYKTPPTQSGIVLNFPIEIEFFKKYGQMFFVITEGG